MIVTRNQEAGSRSETTATAGPETKVKGLLSSLLRRSLTGKSDSFRNRNENIGVPPLGRSVTIGSVVINLLALALPLVILQVYDRVLPNQSYDTLSLLLLGLTGVMILDTFMKLARSYLVGWNAARYEHQLALAAMERVLDAPPHLIENDAPSINVDRMLAIDALRDFYGGQSRLLLLDLPFTALFLLLIAIVGGPIVFVPLALFVVLGAATVICSRSLRSVLETRSAYDDRKYDFIVEVLGGIHTVKSMAMEPQVQRRFERLQKSGIDAAYRTIVLGNSAQSYGNLFANLTMISMVSVGAVFVIKGDLTIGSLACCTLLAGRTIQPLLKGLGLWTQLQSLSISRRRVDELFSLPPVRTDRPASVAECDGRIQIRDLAFGYESEGPALFEGIDLDVEPGEIVGLRGEDGSGKTTFVRLMLGQLAASRGEIRIGGYDVCGPWGDALSEWVAYVPQSTSVFKGTILENITMFRTGDAIDAAREAARLIGLEADIHRLPDGYDTPISEGITEELPAGFMQRIVIARALARRPRVLIFDEAYGALDASSDRQLREAFEQLRGRMTVVVVSLRPSLLRVADRVFELRGGALHLDPSYGAQPPENAMTPDAGRAGA